MVHRTGTGIFSTTLYENNQPVSGFRMNNMVTMKPATSMRISIQTTLRRRPHDPAHHPPAGLPGWYLQRIQQQRAYLHHRHVGAFLRIAVSDADGNSSDLLFGIQRDSSAGNTTAAKPVPTNGPCSRPATSMCLKTTISVSTCRPIACTIPSGFRTANRNPKPVPGLPVAQCQHPAA